MAADEERLTTPTDAASGPRLERTPFQEKQSATVRARLARRELIVATCEFCGAPFETYAGEGFSVRRFCSPAHQRRAYYLAHRPAAPGPQDLEDAGAT